VCDESPDGVLDFDIREPVAKALEQVQAAVGDPLGEVELALP
jgi:hypothetical protein